MDCRVDTGLFSSRACVILHFAIISAMMKKSDRVLKKTVAKPIVAPAISERGKRIRLGLLVVGIVFLAVGYFLPSSFDLSAKKEAATTEGLTTSFSKEPVTVDKKLLASTKRLKERLPVRILIPSLNIDLAVKEARVINGYWEVFSGVAGFGEGSALPGDIGNQVIFAHAKKNMFLDLPKIGDGATIYVLSPSGWYNYRVVAKKEVSPSQTEVIAPTTDETLTIYTCSGFADSKRLIVIAKRVK